MTRKYQRDHQLPRLHCPPEPCTTCPYRRDTPSGVWDATEYDKLAQYDEDHPAPSYQTFLCHNSTANGVETACRGWLAVHGDSIAARIAMMRGEITEDDCLAPVQAPLYASGAEARDAGKARIDNPQLAALLDIARLTRKGVGRA